MERQVFIHIFMDGCFTQMDSFALQKDSHTPMPWQAVIIVINRFDFLLYVILLFLIYRFALFQVVIISIGRKLELSKQPA